MANIKNNHTGPLSVGGVTIPAGVTASVEGWASVQHSNAIKTWLAAKIIEVVGGEAGLPAGIPGLPGLPDPEAAEKDAIIAELRDKYGVEKTKRTSLDNLKAALAEAKASA